MFVCICVRACLLTMCKYLVALTNAFATAALATFEVSSFFFFFCLLLLLLNLICELKPFWKHENNNKKSSRIIAATAVKMLSA